MSKQRISREKSIKYMFQQRICRGKPCTVNVSAEEGQVQATSQQIISTGKTGTVHVSAENQHRKA
jgi:hypothetical protein